MGPKINVMERAKKNSTFRVHLNQAQDLNKGQVARLPCPALLLERGGLVLE
jgi:hypothetical protein